MADEDFADDASQAQVPVPTDTDKRGGKVTFSVTLTARLPTAPPSASSLHDPYFRFQFLDGTKVVTTPVGTVDEDADVAGQGVWTRRPTVPKAKPGAAEGEGGSEGKEAEGEGGQAAASANANAEDETEQPDDDSAPWVWTRQFGPIDSTAEFARAIDGSPGLAVFVADSTGQQGRRYVADCQLDASAFLGGDIEIGETHGVDDAAGWNETTDLASNNFAGFNFLDVRIRASHRLLDAELEAQLNPLSITIHKVKDLPGARLHLDSDKERPFAEPDLFHLLRQNCAPVYCLFKFPVQPAFDPPPLKGGVAPGGETVAEEKDALDAELDNSAVPSGNRSSDTNNQQEQGQEPALRDRVCVTRGGPNGEKVRWEHTTVFLAGVQNPDKLYEYLDSRPLAVELHDRDILPSADEKAAHIERFEALAREYEEARRAAEAANGGAAVKAKGKAAAAAAKKKKKGKQDSVADASSNIEEAEEDTGGPDVFAADREFLADREASFVVAGDGNSFGLASFRMDGLLNRADELRQGLKRAAIPQSEREELQQQVEVKLTEVTMPQKRRIVPTGAAKIAEWDMSDAERLCRRPGDYAGYQTRISASFRIARPIHRVTAVEKVPLPVFERIVYIFPYDDLAMLRVIRDCIDAVNSAAIPRVSLPSYQLTAQQKAAAATGALDVVCGFQIVEEGQRMIVVEGLVHGGMAKLHEALPRADIAAKDPLTTKVFSNDQVLFTERVYTPFEVDLKMIRLRRPLAAILKSADIYNRGNVSATCFDALHCLGEVKKANRMRTLKVMNLFPTVEGLEELESKYGETVTLMDMRGLAKKPKRMGAGAAVKKAGGTRIASAFSGATGLMVSAALKSRIRRQRNKAPTETHNSAYLTALENWKPKDFISGQVQQAATLREKTRLRKQHEFEEAKKDPTPVYIYGTQKLNSMALAQAKQREQVSKDRNATYTYAPDYVGQTIAPVDPFAVEEAQRAANKAKFVTPKGFVYPAPRSPEEFSRHPKALAQSQIDELAQPWEGPPGTRQPGEVERGSLFDPHILTAKGFDTRSLRPIDSFGLQRKDGTQDPEFKKSVHCGEADAEAAAQKKKEEEAAWRAKVVVDTLHFQPAKSLKHGNQLDKLSGMLDGPVKKHGLIGNSIPALVPHDPFVDPLDREKANNKSRGTTLPKEVSGLRSTLF
eukprot:INCI15056.2.p1 GENE.INCI15056.2~~INCI15056.2.p1  ORF type:complete len:1175 (-),score=230.15 INCI15056.2:595-4119(-)